MFFVEFLLYTTVFFPFLSRFTETNGASCDGESVEAREAPLGGARHDDN